MRNKNVWQKVIEKGNICLAGETVKIALSSNDDKRMQ